MSNIHFLKQIQHRTYSPIEFSLCTEYFHIAVYSILFGKLTTAVFIVVVVAVSNGFMERALSQMFVASVYSTGCCFSYFSTYFSCYYIAEKRISILNVRIFLLLIQYFRIHIQHEQIVNRVFVVWIFCNMGIARVHCKFYIRCFRTIENVFFWLNVNIQ